MSPQTEHTLTLSPSPKGQAVLDQVKNFIKKHVEPREKAG